MRIGRWAALVAWACVILISTSLPGAAVPAGPPGMDKVGHFVMYAVLGLLAIRAVLGGAESGLRTVALTLGAIAAFAAIDEWHQRFVPTRAPDVADWAADLAGATVGVGSMAIFTLRRSARS